MFMNKIRIPQLLVMRRLYILVAILRIHSEELISFQDTVHNFFIQKVPSFFKFSAVLMFFIVVSQCHIN